MEIFPFLSFPSIVTDIILRKLTPYELFAFSLHSEEARNILKRFSSSHKFHMNIDLSYDRLIFNYENEKKKGLWLFAKRQYKPMDHNLKFDGLSDNVCAEIDINENNTLVRVCFKKKQRGQRLQFLIEYMAKIFKNISISIYFGNTYRSRPFNRPLTEELREEMKKEQSRLRKIIKATIKKCNFNIRSYNDINDVHKFKELEQLIFCEELNVSECRLTKEELKKLYDKWMALESPGEIALEKIKNFKLEDLSAGNPIETKDEKQFFEVTRDDGIKARITFDWGRLTFEII